MENNNDIGYRKMILELVIDSTEDLIFYKDYTNEEGRYVVCNEACCELVNMTKEEIIGHTDIEIFGEELGNFFKSEDMDVIHSNKNKIKEKWVTYPDGREVYLSTHKALSRDKNGNIIGITGISRDITKEYKYRQEIENQKKSLEIAHKKITDSIQFASLIQQAILPQENTIEKYVKEHFTIWQPKDIVGGDIYFFIELEKEIIVMVIDGAGHGVPGAFVTMLVKAIKAHVDGYIKDGSLEKSPAKILEYFNVSIKTMLKQKKGSRSNAGFDGGILYYNKETKECKFAGAKTDLYIIENNELKVINGDRKHVGFVRTKIDQKYTEHKIEIKENTKLYITTDGYLDQEGENKSRFGIERFEELLLKMSDKSLKEQKNILIEELNKFKKDKLQTDDITIVGLEF